MRVERLEIYVDYMPYCPVPADDLYQVELPIAFYESDQIMSVSFILCRSLDTFSVDNVEEK